MLAQDLPQAVAIELYAINLIPNDFTKAAGRFARWREPCVIEDLVSLTANWLRRGFDVIVPGLFWQDTHERMCDDVAEALGSESIDCPSFILAPPLEVAVGSSGRRLIDSEMQEFIREQYEAGLREPGFGIVIDNQRQTPEETFRIIQDHLLRQADVGT